MLAGPIFGYFGDRYSRRWLMAFGVTLWSFTTLVGSFMNVSFEFSGGEMSLKCFFLELLVVPAIQSLGRGGGGELLHHSSHNHQ